MLPINHQALTRLIEAMHTNQEYADAWHDNIACCVSDEEEAGFSSPNICYKTANEVASRIMKHCFGVETKNLIVRTKSKIIIVPASDSFISNWIWEKASFDYKEINSHDNPKELIKQVVDSAKDPYYGGSGRTNTYVAYNILLQLNRLASRPNPNKYDYGVYFDRRRGKFGGFYVGENTPISDEDPTVIGTEPPENDEVELQIKPIPTSLLDWLNELCGACTPAPPKTKIEEIRPVHYVNNIHDDNAFCGEYTWKPGMNCTMNIFDVTCGCCAEKFHQQVGTVKWRCGHYNRKNLVGDCPECQGVGLTHKQETWRDREPLL